MCWSLHLRPTGGVAGGGIPSAGVWLDGNSLTVAWPPPGIASPRILEWLNLGYMAVRCGLTYHLSWSA